MKKSVTLLLAAALCINFVSALNNPIKNWMKKQKARTSFGKTELAYAPQLTIGYFWDDMEEPPVWVFTDSVLTQYNEKGIITFEERIFGGSFKVRTYYELNSSGNVTASYRLNWDPFKNMWDSTSKSFYTYNNTGFETEFREYRYNLNSNSWVIDFAYQTEYVTSANNKIIEKTTRNWVPHLGIYRNNDRSIYTYNASGEVSTVEAFEWDTLANGFKESYRAKDIVWHKFFPNDIEASLSSSLLIQEWTGNSYQDSERGKSEYDAKDNIVSDKWEEKDGASWVVSYWDQYTYTYDNNGAITEEIEKSYDVTSENFVNNNKRLYANFFVYNSLNEKRIERIESVVYPNPIAKGETLQVNATNAIAIDIYNIEGKLIQTTEINNGKAKLESDLNTNGLYYYHIKDKNNQIISTGKLVIE